MAFRKLKEGIFFMTVPNLSAREVFLNTTHSHQAQGERCIVVCLYIQ